MKSYLIKFDEAYDIYVVDIMDDDIYSYGVAIEELLAENIAPEIMSAFIYRLLEELKEKKLEGYDKAFGET